MAYIIYAFNRVVPMNFPQTEVEILGMFDKDIHSKNIEHRFAVRALKGKLM